MSHRLCAFAVVEKKDATKMQRLAHKAIHDAMVEAYGPAVTTKVQ